MLRTAVRAVAAGGARNQLHPLVNTANLFNGFGFGLVKGFEITHIAYVISELLNAAHARKHNKHPREACSEANCVARGTPSVERRDNSSAPRREA